MKSRLKTIQLSINMSVKQGMNYKVFNDAVHGHMSFHPLLVKIIDTKEFQRLRNIKQLGVAYYVYPSASHNRFEHSLGTCHIAGKLLDALIQSDADFERPTDQEKLCVQIAGLCHDLGHGPFSHTWETFLRKAKAKGAIDNTWRHEKSSVEIFDKLIKNDDIKKAMKDEGLTEKHIKLIKDLIVVPKHLNNSNKYYLYQIISNQDNDVDVDKWEYLMRDQKQLNISINFDMNRLLNFCQVLRVNRDDRDRSEICFRDKEVTNILDMLITRATLHEKAYQHRAVKIIETMLVDALLAAHTACPELRLVDSSVDNLLTLSDHIFYSILYSKDKKLVKAQELLTRIETRRLYQAIHKHSLSLTEGSKMNSILGENNEDKSQVLDKLTEGILETINQDGHLINKNDLEIIQIRIDMGSKFKEASNYYVFKKGSKVPIFIDGKSHLFADSLKKYLRTELLVLYKGSRLIDKVIDKEVKKRMTNYFQNFERSYNKRHSEDSTNNNSSSGSKAKKLRKEEK